MPPAFRILLAAKIISALGSQVSGVALPLTAILFLHVTPFQMGLLAGAGMLPGVLFGLVAGVAIEPLPKRAVLLAANAVSAALLSLIPFGHAVKHLTFALLLAVNFAAAGIASAEGIALMSFMPAIVEKPQLASANRYYSSLLSVTQVAGPAVAGFLIALLTAPGAIALDAASFAAATALMLFLPAIPAAAAVAPEPVWRRLRGGIDFSFQQPTIRLFILFAIAINLFGGGIMALQALFIVKQLGVPATWYGASLAIGGIGAIAGALISARIARRLNINAMLALVIFIAILADGFICTLHGACAYVAGGFALAKFFDNIGNGALGAAVWTYIQTVTPPAILARVIGALVTIIGASAPLGAMLAGTFANRIGLRPTIILETAGFAVALAFILAVTRGSLFAPPASL